MKLFVFGTLMSGYNANRILGDGATKVCDAHLEKHRMFNLGFPGLKYDPRTDKKVLGEIWDVPDANIRRVDEYEGTPHLFKRVLVDRELIPFNCWEYLRKENTKDYEIQFEDLWMYEYQWDEGTQMPDEILPNADGVVSYRNKHGYRNQR